MSYTFLLLVHSVGAGGSFFIYAMVSCGAFYFVWRVMPETRGKTLEQIERYFEEASGMVRPSPMDMSAEHSVNRN